MVYDAKFDTNLKAKRGNLNLTYKPVEAREVPLYIISPQFQLNLIMFPFSPPS